MIFRNICLGIITFLVIVITIDLCTIERAINRHLNPTLIPQTYNISRQKALDIIKMVETEQDDAYRIDVIVR